ncbi:MAG: chemotaxis protein CheW [Thermoanaerobaculales bacterium]|nr:chemotaxis protein CheW [Thermoanaerobaculales bacterium]
MSLQLCTFHVGDLLLGIEVVQIQEVLRKTPVTPVPKTPPAISGLINLRGQIVTAVDLRRMFRVKVDSATDAPTMLILDSGSELRSLVVDTVGEVVTVTEGDFEEPPDTLRGESRKLIRGAYKLKDRLLLVLDVKHTMKAATEGRS